MSHNRESRSSYRGRFMHDQVITIRSTLSRVFTGHSTATGRDQCGHSSSWHRQFRSSGRGGAGNIHVSPDSGDHASTFDAFEDLCTTKEGSRSQSSPKRYVSAGRGGAGNIRARSPISRYSSTVSEADESEYQRLLVRDVTRNARPHHSGRGGSGNVTIPDTPPGAVLISISIATL
ncbi:hypothetical protein BC827DRAFT_1167434 [Russula dissimulans]|nr:hypothetical protein BC827DRAFT_1167434 [Russula dissimulans]